MYISGRYLLFLVLHYMYMIEVETAPLGMEFYLVQATFPALHVYIDGGTRGYYRVLPSGRILPHIHRVFNIIWTSTETAAQSWHHSYRGGIYPARYLTTSGPFHNPQPPFHELLSPLTADAPPLCNSTPACNSCLSIR